MKMNGKIYLHHEGQFHNTDTKVSTKYFMKYLGTLIMNKNILGTNAERKNVVP